MKIQRPNHKWVLFIVFLAFSPHAGHSQSSGTKEGDAQLHYKRAEEALRNNKPNEATDEFQEVLRLDPNNAEARADLGAIQFVSGDYSKAAQNFREALKLRPSLWKAQALLGMCEKRLGRIGEAQKLLESSFPRLQDEKFRLSAGMDLVEIEYQEGDLTKAGDVLKVLQKLSPADVDVIYTSYRVYSKLEYQAMESLAMVAPDSARMHQLIAEHLINTSDLGDAIEQYRKAMQLDSRLPGIHYELGEAILQQSTSQPSLKEAEVEFNAELAVSPNDPKAECKLGHIYTLQSNLEAAFQHYSRALQLNPNDVDAQIGLGEVLASMGRREKAFECYLSAERLDPLNETAHYRLATMYKQMGRKTEADSEMSAFEKLQEMKKGVIEVFQQMHQQMRGGEAIPNAPQ